MAELHRQIKQAVRRSDEEERERRFRSLSESDHPQQIKAADGETDLFRFDVKGVVYARNRVEAVKACDSWNLGTVLSACVVEEP